MKPKSKQLNRWIKIGYGLGDIYGGGQFDLARWGNSIP